MTIHQSPRDLSSGIVSQPSGASFSAPRNQAGIRSRSPLAPCVALIGCDGSGKSTLASDLVSVLDRRSPTRSMYLGLGTGDLGRRIGEIPLVGRLAERFLTGKAKKAHDGKSTGKEKRLPGLATALAMFGFSLARRRRFRQVLDFRRQGVQVITDRYPQAEVPGSFDGPGLSWLRKGSALVERLATRERALYAEMAAYRPTLVIRLNVDVDTALARKSDHQRDMLEKKLAVVPTLRFGGAQIVDVDATRPYREVLESVLAVLRRHGLEA
jgi:thymidylate kinase